MYDPQTIKNERTRSLFINGDKQRSQRKSKRLRKPVVQLCDGDWTFQHRIDPFIIDANFDWKKNDSGSTTINLPVKGSPALNSCISWLLDPWGRPKAKNIGIRMDKDGARWTGFASSVRLTKNSKGERTVTIEGTHEYEELKRIYCWPNPFLPSVVQFPRAWTMFGSAAHILKTTLLCNLMRLHGSWWTLPDDPLDITKWDATWDMRDWPVVVKPRSKLLDTTPFTVISGRMKTWHDMAQGVLDDCQLMVETRRWFIGDPPPWPGANLSNGTLVVDIVDKSGWWSEEGTSIVGDIWEGFIRNVQQLTSNGIDTVSTIIDEPTVVPEYDKKDWLGTIPRAPYVLYRDRMITGVESVDFTWQPATTVQVIAGGTSMPGVNEAISAGVQAAGNALGTFVAVPTAGTIADTVLKPLYSDVFLAWTQHKSLTRAQGLGRSRYQEYFAEGSDTALTLSSLVAIRKAFWDTRERFSHKMTLGDGAPWYIGDQGEGHFWLGDRVGSTIQELPKGKIIVEEVSQLTFRMSRKEFGWEATMGDFAATESALDHLIRGVKKVTSAVHDQGVW